MAEVAKKRKKKVVAEKKVLRKGKKKKMKAPQFQVEWVDIASIKLWEDNPRYNDEAAEKLSLIIKDHGFKTPIVCWDKNRVIYKGNTTFKAAKILGFKKVPVIFHSFESELAAKAYGIADNKASELADWDEDVLVEMMKAPEFKKLNKNVGFTDTELKMLDFYPPDVESESKAKKKGEELTFKISLEVTQSDYEEFLGNLKQLVEDFEGVKLK